MTRRLTKETRLDEDSLREIEDEEVDIVVNEGGFRSVVVLA